MATGRSPRRLSLDRLGYAAAYTDPTGCILAANDAFRAFWRQARGDRTSVEGHPLLALFDESDRAGIGDIVAAHAVRRRRSRCTARLAGTLASIMAEFAPARNARGKVWLVTLRSPERPEHSDDEPLKALLGGVLHDLRASAHVVLGWASLLRRDHEDPERVAHALASIERTTALQTALLDDLLELARPSSARSAMRRQPIDLSELVGAEVHALEPLARQSGVHVALIVESPELAVQANVVHLRRVLANLLGNALKFTPRGGTIECRLWRSAAWAGIVIRDSGRGIERQFLPRVFDAFSQNARHVRSGGGMGLGLSVVRHLVELHGGKVDAASEGNGRGATFTVRLPALSHASAASVPLMCSGL